jgi:hypothetical protein
MAGQDGAGQPLLPGRLPSADQPAGTTRVLSRSVLSAGPGSAVIAVAVAELVIVRGAPPTRTLIVTVRVWPAGRSPSLQVTVAPDAEHDPVVAVAESRVTWPGSRSVTVTPVAAAGPEFSTDSS